MNRTLVFALAAAPLAFVVAACSGSSATFVGADDGGTGGDGSTTDGGPLPDGGDGGAFVCPATAPQNGAACTAEGLTCEFGGAGVDRLCSTQAICLKGTSGVATWQVTLPAPGCVGTPDQNPAACPATFTTLPTGSACPQQGLACVYTQGMCGCVTCFGDSGVTNQNEWACDVFPAPTGCPVPRPLIGSACTQEGLTCSYGEQCGVVGGPDLGCQGGRWASLPRPAGGACAVRQCGK
jgi:hypothetical protein